MGRRVITYSLDVEATGPIPGPWSMCSLGICRTEQVDAGLGLTLKPLVIPGLSKPDRADAMRVVAEGLPDIHWDPEAGDEENVAVVRRYFEEQGQAPEDALQTLKEWLGEDAGPNRPVIVGSPVTFDFMWLYWYWWFLRDEMPPFGYSGLDVRSYFMGSHGVGFQGTGKARYLKHYPNQYQHTHDPLDDARQQGAIWNDMVQARLERKE